MNIIGRCVFDILASLGDADRQTDRPTDAQQKILLANSSWPIN